MGYVDNRAAGLANCFLGFSTFLCRPLVNLHDLAVMPEQQGQGIGSALLEAVARKAVARDCCKVTLEVLASNQGARQLYRRHGFGGNQTATEPASTLFLEKMISE